MDNDKDRKEGNTIKRKDVKPDLPNQRPDLPEVSMPDDKMNSKPEVLKKD